jgi:4-diphosphocytidyl-2-C-methyl-D-erythritol kinase
MKAAPGPSCWLAPAKLNLRLEVLGRRSDGYHELATTFLALDWCDRVTLRRAARPGVSMSLGGPAASDDIPRDHTNLAWRAAEAFFEARPAGGGVAIELIKELPSKAGLGGGSADAAAVLLGLCALHGEPEQAALAPLAWLGSDTVFFAAARASGYAHGRGRGERVEPLPLPPAAGRRWFALAMPGEGASTSAVYARLGLEAGAFPERASAPRDWLALELSELRGLLFNGLEQAAIECSPGVAGMRSLLDGIGLSHWRLTGSGAAFFGVYDDPEEARLDLLAVGQTARALGQPLSAARVCRPFGSGPREARAEEQP